MAQEFDKGDGDGDDVNDEIQVPINENVAAIFAIGPIAGYVHLKRKREIQ